MIRWRRSTLAFLILGALALMASKAVPSFASETAESSEFADVKAMPQATDEAAASSPESSVPRGANPNHHVHVQFCTS